MSGNFRIEFEDEDGDLRVNPVGDLDEDAAWKFILFLFRNYDGKGNVFVKSLCQNCCCSKKKLETETGRS